MDDTPDYTTYSLKDLRDVKKRIDSQKFPDRYQLVIEEIARKEQWQSTQATVATSSVSFLSQLVDAIVGGVIGLFIGGVLGFVALMIMVSGLSGSLDGATGMGNGMIMLGAILGGIVGCFAGWSGIKHILKL